MAPEWEPATKSRGGAYLIVGVSGLSDEELLAGAGRDSDAFGQLYARHHRELLGFFVRRTADAQLAADLTAETFAQAFVARRRFRAVVVVRYRAPSAGAVRAAPRR